MILKNPVVERRKHVNAQPTNIIPPFRSSLLTTAAEKKEHACRLARKHLFMAPAPLNILRHLEENERELQQICTAVAKAIEKDLPVTPAADCLLNNLHLIESQLLKDKERLKRSAYPADTFSRIYDIAVELIAHSNAQVDQKAVKDFVAAYQEVSFLKLAELKLLHVAIRAALIENIRRISAGMSHIRTGTAEETAKQAPNYLSLWNSVHSLHQLAAVDWRRFVESTSVVEQALGKDPGAAYTQMDIYTREQYRKAIEEIAAGSGKPEHAIAQTAISLAKENITVNIRMAHVGYYLLGPGRTRLEKEAGCRVAALEKLRRQQPAGTYVGAIILLTVITTGLFIKAHSQVSNVWLLSFTAALLFIAMLQPAGIAVNWLLSLLVRPALLSRMDFSKGVPAYARTLVVVPALLGSRTDVETLAAALELRFLGNKSKHLHFSLLTDYKDADQETLPEDAPLLQAAREAISALNIKYGSPEQELFFLFHRKRCWNAAERTWMGYERKRGKLEELNALLRGGAKDSFSLIVGRQNIFPAIKYVITLDADTQLPRDAAWKMAAAMAHPLNSAVCDTVTRQVTAGYGILQPRVSVDIPAANRSWYARLHGHNAGIDPYTRALPDLYQDIFGEGSFIGKGIYDVDVCLQVLQERLPENRILSHDLLEGCYLRSGLLSDVCLYEEQSYSYHIDLQRRHRWIRGDWQIAAWLLPWVPGAGGRLQRNPINLLSRWKIFDNLCRSLHAVALLLLLVMGWTVFKSGIFWTGAVTGILLLPCLLAFTGALLKKRNNRSVNKYLADAVAAAIGPCIQMLLTLVWLPAEAFCATDAIVRVHWRLWVSRRKLLEWNQSANLHGSTKTLPGLYRLLWAGPFTGIAAGIYLSLFHPLQLLIAEPLLVAWILSPLVTWQTGKTLQQPLPGFTAAQQFFLRKLARKTWHFFETFVGPWENWLPPDHYQEFPENRVAHYTSPTNLGLALLANLSAVDFGYITPAVFIERTAGTVNAMKKLERYQGHFYNWYDTITFQPAQPRYVSTVDSGNLAGHVLVLRQGMRHLLKQPVLGPALLKGLQDELYLLEEETNDADLLRPAFQLLEQTINVPALTFSQLHGCITQLAVYIDEAQVTSRWLQAISDHLQQIRDELQLWAPWLYLPAAATGLPEQIPSLNEAAEYITACRSRLAQAKENVLLNALEKTAGIAASRINTIEQLGVACADFAEMEYDFLYDEQRHLLAIGYKPETHQRDTGCYDLLASEARLGIYVAIAQGKLPQRSWFALGRPVISTAGSFSLLSWNGTMFEYLMPLLVMPDYEQTLLHQTMEAMVMRQIEYGRENSIPWGMSECAQHVIEASLSYRYRPTGVPGLGVKRGLEKELVIAPYATVMALMVAPEAACRNLEVLTQQGFQREYGFYEAVDYLPSRLPEGESHAIVRSFMIHHQGMGFLSLAYLLHGKPMQKHFEADPVMKAALLLLQEKTAKETAFHLPSVEPDNTLPAVATALAGADPAAVNMLAASDPEMQWLSNGRYQVMITNTGTNASRWKHIAVTPWQPDVYNNHGIGCYIRDVEKDTTCCVTSQPPDKINKHFRVAFAPGKAFFQHTHQELVTDTTIAVSPQDDLEIRKLVIHNRSKRQRTIEVTSYAEVMLSPVDKTSSFPDRSFVHTAIHPGEHAIICTQYLDDPHIPAAAMFHVAKAYGGRVEAVNYETDGLKFTGPGYDRADPNAIRKNTVLSNNQGIMLNAIVALQHRIMLEPQETVTLHIYLGAAETREACILMVNKCQAQHFADQVFAQAHTQQYLLLKQLGMIAAEAEFCRNLASRVFNLHMSSAGQESPFAQTILRRYGISKEIPTILLQVENADHINQVRQLIQAHTYWQAQGLKTNLVLYIEDDSCYRHFLKAHIMEIIVSCTGTDVTGHPGGIFLIQADGLPDEERLGLYEIACLILNRNGELFMLHSPGYNNVRTEPAHVGV